MSDLVKIPTETGLGCYDFDIELDGELFNLSFRYNSRMDRWIMDIGDLEGNAILNGIPLIIGVELLSEYVKTELPQGYFFVINLTEDNVDAGEDTLGTDAFLYYYEVT